MIEMMFCDSDSVIWDIQHKKSRWDIINNEVNHRRIEEENINEDHSEQTACMESHRRTPNKVKQKDWLAYEVDALSWIWAIVGL